MSDSIDTQLLSKIQNNKHALIAFCQSLLQTPSVNGTHDEVHVARVIAEEAQKLGLHSQIIGENPDRPNVIVSTNPGQQTGLLLVGHLDTVPSGDPVQWTHPPFSGEISDGRIYGRGAIDTKGGIASAIYALAALAETEGALANKQAQLICVPDEETGATGTLGIKFLHKQGLLQGTGAIYAYSGNVIHIGHRGLIRYQINCAGESVHTGAIEWQNKESGANAVTAMASLLLKLESHQFMHSTLPYFDAFRTIITPGTIIHGGTNINIVPNECEALIDIRTTPETPLHEIDAIIQHYIDEVCSERARISFKTTRLNYLPAAISDKNTPIFTCLSAVTEELTGIKPDLAVAGPANEGYLLVERNIPTVCGFGPTGANFHGIDEYVEIDSLVEAAQIFCLTAKRLSDI